MAARIMCMGSVPVTCCKGKRARREVRPRPRIKSPRINSSIENLLKKHGCRVAVKREPDTLQPTGSITAARNALNSCRRIRYQAAVVNFPLCLRTGERGRESLVEIREKPY